MFVWIAMFVLSLGYVITPAVIALSWRIGAVDVPQDWRRMHRESIPRNGGLAVLIPFFLGVVLMDVWSPFLTAILLGGGILLLVGLTDDIFGLSAPIKLFFQIIATTCAVIVGGVAQGWWIFAAVLWVVLLINAHNFIYGMDGLLCGCGAIESLMLCACFFLMGKGILGEYALLLAIACFAFRFYNRYPARIFAGDCGSEPIGFLLGMLSLPLFQGVAFGSLTPILIFAYPIADLICAVVRRLLRGYSPFRADRAHLHHRLYAAGIAHPTCTDLLLSLCGAVGIVGVLLCIEILWSYACLACLVVAWFLTRVRRYVVAEQY